MQDQGMGSDQGGEYIGEMSATTIINIVM